MFEWAEYIRTQQRKGKHKLYVRRASELECICKGNAKKPYEFGVRLRIPVTHKSGLVVGARTFPGTPYDGRILSEQPEQTGILLGDVGVVPKHAIIDLVFRGVDLDSAGVELLHRGKAKS